MKYRKTFLMLVIPILAATLATTSRSAANVPDHGPSAFGAGLFRFRNFEAQLELWSFSFEAVANKNGHTRGRAQFDNLTAHTQVVVRINCLNIEQDVLGLRAVISGTVLHSDDPLHPKMQNVIFAASDGPLLPSSTADTITPPFELPTLDGQPLTCRDGGPLTILDVEEGDIQIHL
jgi:hypothetical protein